MKEYKNLEKVTILAIETSCDETSVAVVENGKEVLSNIVSSQIETHKQFGGVVPEIASRQHIEVVMQIVEEALEEAQVTLDAIDAICVTQGPGLIGSLLVGVNVAKTLSYALDKPLIGAHHIAGHIYANQRDEMNARKYYIKAMDQGDYREDTLFRVWVYGERKEINGEVVEAFKRNLNKNIEVKNALAFYYQRHDYFDEAEKLYKELVNEKYPNAERLLGELYMSKKDYDKAEKWLLKESENLFSHSEDNVKRIEEKRARLLRLLAKVYEMKGDYGKAENNLLKAKELAHKELALTSLAKLYEKQGKYSQALKINEELEELKKTKKKKN